MLSNQFQVTPITTPGTSQGTMNSARSNPRTVTIAFSASASAMPISTLTATDAPVMKKVLPTTCQ